MSESEPADIDDTPGAFLERAKERAQAGSPQSTTIRRLVNLFDAKRRGSTVVSRIQHELDQRGLVTDPDFTNGWIDNRVVILVSSPTAALNAPVVPNGEAPSGSSPVAVTLTIRSLAAATRTVAFVDRNQTLDQARGLMLRDDFSQIAVVSSGPRNPVGAVSWESMAKAALRKPDFSLADATIQATTVKLDDNLITLVPTIVEQGFVFVIAEDKALCGIVTTADLGDQFATLAKPFFLLGEVERRLRHIIDGVFSAEELAGIQDPDDPRAISGAGDLTIGEIQRLLEQQVNWERLAWPVDRGLFTKQLNAVREIRNEVMHFSPDPLDDEQLETLANFIKWLRVHDPR